LKRFSVLVLIFSFLIVSCFNDNDNKIDDISTKDSSFVIFKLDSVNRWLIKNAAPASLNSVELNLIDSILRKAIDNYNSDRKIWLDSLTKSNPAFSLSLEDLKINVYSYKRQYLPYLNSNGEKEVWVNCLCDTNKNWKDGVLIIEDGGKCYFNLIINLSNKSSHTLIVNGEA
jgi:hypothetical protein